jgi:hypothetical protein
MKGAPRSDGRVALRHSGTGGRGSGAAGVGRGIEETALSNPGRSMTSPLLRRARPVGATILLILLMTTAGNSPSAGQPRNWTEEKCHRYSQATTDALRRWGNEGLGRDFLDRHARFIAGGCTGEADVCPRSPREIELANILTVRALNAGMASTFLPFGCRP